MGLLKKSLLRRNGEAGLAPVAPLSRLAATEGIASQSCRTGGAKSGDKKSSGQK